MVQQYIATANFAQVISQGAAAAASLQGMATAAAAVGPASASGAAAANAALGRMGSSVARTGKAMTVGLTVPILAAGAAAVKAFADSDKAITAAGQKAGATAEELQKMKDLALQLGKTMPFSITESSVAMDQMAAAGLNAAQVMDALPIAMQAAVASGEDLALTADTIAKAMNAFGISSKNTGHIADVFAVAANKTALSMQGIAEGFRHAGELGPAANQSIEGVTAAMAQLADSGVPAASAGTAVVQMVQQLQAPLAKGAKMMNALGIETRDATGKMLPIYKLVENFKVALNESNPAFRQYIKDTGLSAEAAKDQALNVVFGIQGMKAMNLIMAGNKPVTVDMNKNLDEAAQLTRGLAKLMGKDAADAFVKAHTKAGVFTAKGVEVNRVLTAMMMGADGASKKVADIMSQTLQQKIQRAGAAFAAVGNTLANILVPAIESAAKWFTDLFNRIGEIAKTNPFGETIVKTLLFLAAAGPVVLLLGKITSGFALLGKASGLAGKGILPIGIALGLLAVSMSNLHGPIRGVVLALGALALLKFTGFFSMLASGFGRIRTTLAPVTGAFRNFATQIQGIARLRSISQSMAAFAPGATQVITRTAAMGMGFRALGVAALGAGRSLAAAFASNGIGIAIVAITAAIGYFSGKSAEAAERVRQQQQAVEDLAATMNKANGELTTGTQDKIVEDFAKVSDQMQQMGVSSADGVAAMVSGFKDGGVALQQFRETAAKNLDLRPVLENLSNAGASIVSGISDNLDMSAESIVRAVAMGGPALDQLTQKMLAAGYPASEMGERINEIRRNVEAFYPGLSAIVSKQTELTGAMKLSADEIATLIGGLSRLAGVSADKVTTAFDNATKSGMSLEEALKFVGITGDAAAKIIAGMEGKTVVAGNGLNYMSDEAAKAADEYAQLHPKAENAAKSTAAVGESARKTGDQAATGRQSIADLARGFKATDDAAKAADTRMQGFLLTLQRLSGRDVDLATMNSFVNSTMTTIADGFEAQAAAVDAHSKAVKDNADDVAKYTKAVKDAETGDDRAAAQKSLDESIAKQKELRTEVVKTSKELFNSTAAYKATGNIFDTTTKAGQQLENTVQDLPKAYAELVAGTTNAASKTGGLTAGLAAGRKAATEFRKQLIQNHDAYGLTAQQATILADRLGIVNGIKLQDKDLTAKMDDSDVTNGVARTNALRLQNKMALLKADDTPLQTKIAIARQLKINPKNVVIDGKRTLYDSMMAQLNRETPKSKSVKVNAETSQARADINALLTTQQKTIVVRQIPGGGLARSGNAMGTGADQANGSIRYAADGLISRRDPMIAPGGSNILWAEPETGWEAYIPGAMSKRARSIKLLEETARRMGRIVIPMTGKAMANGGITAMAAGGIPSVAALTGKTAATPSVTVGNIVQVLADVRQLFSDVVTKMRDLAGSTRDAARDATGNRKTVERDAAEKTKEADKRLAEAQKRYDARIAAANKAGAKAVDAAEYNLSRARAQKGKGAPEAVAAAERRLQLARQAAEDGAGAAGRSASITLERAQRANAKVHTDTSRQIAAAKGREQKAIQAATLASRNYATALQQQRQAQASVVALQGSMLRVAAKLDAVRERREAAEAKLADKLAERANAAASLAQAIEGSAADLVKARTGMVTVSTVTSKKWDTNLGGYQTVQQTKERAVNSVSDVIKARNAELAKERKFRSDLAKLRAKGLSAAQVSEIAAQGYEQGGSTAALLAGSSKREIAQLNAQYVQIKKTAKAAGAEVAGAMYDAGVNAAKGLVAGLAGQQKSLERTMDRLGRRLADALKKALKIKSPSGVFRDEVGVQITRGVAVGIEKEAGEVERSLGRLIDPRAMGRALARPLVPTPSSGSRSVALNPAAAMGATGDTIGTNIEHLEIVYPYKERVSDALPRTLRALTYTAKRG